MMIFNIQTPDGVSHSVDVPEGRSVLDACQKAGLPMEGLCGGELACSTCHVQVEFSWIEKIPAASADEEDMLDLLPNSVPGSRLGCQIKAAPNLEGLCVRIVSSNDSEL